MVSHLLGHHTELHVDQCSPSILFQAGGYVKQLRVDRTNPINSGEQRLINWEHHFTCSMAATGESSEATSPARSLDHSPVSLS